MEHRHGREVLIFEIGGRRYGLPGSEVRELLRAVAILPLPQASDLIEGVINLRGSVAPVLNLRAWLGLSAKAVEPSEHFVIVEWERHPVVLRVDRVLELARLDAAEVERVGGPLPGEAARVEVAKRSQGLVLLLDLHALVSAAQVATVSPAFQARRGEEVRS